MPQSLIDIQKGNFHSKYMLARLSENNKDLKKIRQIIQTLDGMEKSGLEVDWWYSIIDDYPVAIILTVKRGSTSQFTHLFVDKTLENRDQIVCNLIELWLNTDSQSFITDANPENWIVNCLESIGFRAQRSLVRNYGVTTKYLTSNFGDKYSLRPVEKEELLDIYHKLVKPGVIQGSPVFIGKEQFISQYLSTSENWVVCSDIEDNLIGFSYVLHKHDRMVLYGPYTENEEVEELLLTEYLTHLRMQGEDMVEIVRSAPLDYELQSMLGAIELPEKALLRFRYQKFR